MEQHKRVDFQIKRWELDNTNTTPFERAFYAQAGRPTVAHEVDLPEHDFFPDLVDASTVHPIRPPEPPDLVA